MNNKPQSNYYKNVEEDVVDLKELTHKIFGRWYLFMIFGLIGLAGAYSVNKFLQQNYEVQTTLIAADHNENIGMSYIFESVGLRSQGNSIQNHIGTLKSYSLTRQAIENLNWRVSWYENKIFSEVDLYKYAPFKIENFNPLLNLPGIRVSITPVDNDHCLLSVNEELRISGVQKIIEFEERYKYGDSLQNEFFNFILNKEIGRTIDLDKNYSFTFNDLNSLTKSYLDKLDISLVDPDANIILVKVQGYQAEKEADFLNELSRVFINYGLRQKNRQSENTVNFIDAQLTGIVDSLQSAGRSFTNFRSRNRIVDLGQEAGLVVERLEELQSEESLAQMRLEYYENLSSYLGDADKMEQVIAPSVVGITDPALNSMVVNLGELYSRKSTLSFSVQEKNPSLLALENEIQYMRSSLEENLKNLISNAKIQLEALQERKGQINYQLTQLPKTEQDLVNIKRQFDLNNELYTFLLQKRAEAAITMASNVADIKILDEANLETAAEMGPNRLLNYIIGLFIGLGIPFVIIVFIHYFDQTIKTKEDIEKETTIPVLNFIGHNNNKDYLPVMRNPHSGISESFRILRTNLRYLLNNDTQKVIAIHSTVPGEGKTFFAVNIAVTIAQSNKNVLLVCADMRRPKIHTIFNVPNVKGLSTYLIKKDNIDDIVINSKVKNLTIIPSGPTPPNPAELIGNGNLEKLLEKAKEFFDYIIIDNAPAALVADAAMVGEFADVNLFITRSEHTNKEQVKIIDQFKTQNTIKNLAIVINDVKKGRIGYSGYGKKGYGIYADMSSKKNGTGKTVEV